MSHPVVVLGCGPAGLAAAWAAVQSGREAVIVSNTDRPSRLYGCQYLHAPVPGFEHIRSTFVSYDLIGTPEQYRRKVYGDKWEGRVSPEDFVGAHEAWDIRMTYRKMWTHLIELGTVGLYSGVQIENGVIPDLVYQLDPGRIISTIPAPALCHRDHKFSYHKIYANGSIAEQTLEDDSVTCDGTDGHAWYRISNVFGYRTTEWAQEETAGTHSVPVRKPLETDCDCYPEIYRVGRYGAWRKSYLVHEVYPEVMELLK